jgi:hypothetical protein
MDYIVHDWCGWNDQQGRFTHMPSGDTLLCQVWMGQSDWDKAQHEWFKKYPGLTVHKCNTGPYRPTGDTYGTTEEIIERLAKRIFPVPG